MTSNRIKERISDLISIQLPDHIVFNYPTFLSFIETYYKFLEQNQHAQEILQNARLYADIDYTIENLVDNFFNTYTLNVPKNILANKNLFVKLAKDLYRTKGSEESFRTFFRAFFNEEIEFFYPGDVILKPSSGKWYTPRKLKVKQLSGDPFNLESTIINGSNSGAVAIVDSIISYLDEQNTIYEIYLEPNSINGTFLPGESILGKKLVNSVSNTFITTTATVYHTISKIDIVDGYVGYSNNQPITIISTQGQRAKGYVDAVSDSGEILSIKMENTGYGYSVKPQILIDPPTRVFEGKFRIQSNIAEIKLNNEHGLTIGSNVRLSFRDNVYNSLDRTTNEYNIRQIKSKNSFDIDVSNYYITDLLASTDSVSVDSNVLSADYSYRILQNTTGNISLVHTLNKFFVSDFSIGDNVLITSFHINHGLSTGDVIKLRIKSIDKESYNCNFVTNNSSNVTLSFYENHGLSIYEKINVYYQSNYSNATIGTYELFPPNNARIQFSTIPHYFLTNQNVNVNFNYTLTNSITGSFILENTEATVIFQEPHNFKLNENVIAEFQTARLTDEKDKIQIKGNVNLIFTSNVVQGFNTEFLSNVYSGNVISIGLLEEYTIASVASNTVLYLTSNAEQSYYYSNVYLSSSNLSSNTTILKVKNIPNNKRISVDIIGKANAVGTVKISSNVYSLANNTKNTAVVVNNGYPNFNFIDLTFPGITFQSNSRGVANVTLQNTSNIIGLYANNITISSIPNSKTIIYNQNLVSNIPYSNGNAIVTVSLPNYANYFHEGSCTQSTGDVEENLPNVNLTGDIILYYNSEDYTPYGVLRIPTSKSIELASVQPNTRGKVFVSFVKRPNLQANVNALNIEPSRWLDHSGLLDETFKLQGRINNSGKVYYQPYSYVIKSNKPLVYWENAVRKLLHPAGLELFNEVNISSRFENTIKITPKSKSFAIFTIRQIESSNTIISTDTTIYSSDNLT